MQPPVVTLPTLPVLGTDARFPVRRVICIGRNYRAHAREMGGDERSPPFHFMKSADALLPVEDGEAQLTYPPHTADLHHEVELVVALGGGGRDVPAEEARDLVYGYAIGLDMTRRDLQGLAKAKGRPWSAAKDFDHSAVCGPLHPVSEVGHLRTGSITLDVDGTPRQRGDLSDMTWDVGELLSHVSGLMSLRPGDLVYTGTPEGVGAVGPGQRMVGRIDGLGEITVLVTA